MTRVVARALLLILLFSVALVGCALPGTVAVGGQLPNVGPRPVPTPLPPVRFPEDEAPHRNLTEWWYYTGHLQGTDSRGERREYGFEFTFFQTLRGQLPPYYAAHFAVSDLGREEFHFAERSGFLPESTLPPIGSGEGFNLNLADWSMRGLSGRDHLVAALPDWQSPRYAIDLALVDELPSPVLHGGTGIITYGDAGFSYYYSRPRLSVSGSILDNGERIFVTGLSWMDHQWGNFLTLAGTGWDWFSLQLDDGTSYMFYVIRDADKRPQSLVGTATERSGVTRDIPEKEIRIVATDSWTSPKTGGVYHSGWQIDVPSEGLTLTITPRLLDQELVTQSTLVSYWEGAVTVAGQLRGRAITGQGYVELTGYAPALSAR